MEITVSQEGPRGCGYRKEGGLYLVSGSLSASCGKLPAELCVCPACGQGIKPARGWTWIQPKELFGADSCMIYPQACEDCPMGLSAPERAGLIWIGKTFYPTAESFLEEARTMGVSRRIKSVPRGFEVGVDWVFLAHREAVPVPGQGRRPGVIAVFRPTRIEKIVGVVSDSRTGEIAGELPSEAELEALQKRKITPVIVERLGQTPPIEGVELPA